jgi:hypothetical protein
MTRLGLLWGNLQMLSRSCRVKKSLRQMAIYVAYFMVLLLVWMSSPYDGDSHERLYFYTFLLGFITAFTEILGKFKDEPLRALETIQGFLYHVFNGAVAAFSFYMLQVFDAVALTTESDRVKAVFFAGLGSMVIMRSKLFTARINDEDVAIGPEQVIKVFFHFMEQAIDRVRAQARIDLVKTVMKNLDCTQLCAYSQTMIDSAMALSADDRLKLKQQIMNIVKENPEQPQLKSYRLGFLLLDEMGENFVTKLFTEPRPEWQIKAPPVEAEGALVKLLGAQEEMIDHFAYGPFMSAHELGKRLKWSNTEARQYLSRANPKKALLRGYGLVFSKPAAPNQEGEGLANIELAPNEDAMVEGVLYHLPAKVIEFLDLHEVGYRRTKVQLEQDGMPVEGYAYIAESPLAGLKPTRAYRDLLLLGAMEHGLSDDYKKQLREIPVLAPEGLRSVG